MRNKGFITCSKAVGLLYCKGKLHNNLLSHTTFCCRVLHEQVDTSNLPNKHEHPVQDLWDVLIKGLKEHTGRYTSGLQQGIIGYQPHSSD